VVWSQAYYSVLVSKTGGLGLRPVSIRRTDDNYPAFDRQTYAQPEPGITSAVAAHKTKRGIAANGLTQTNALLCATFEGLALPQLLRWRSESEIHADNDELRGFYRYDAHDDD
jgi:hypothetical protein